MFPEHSLSYVLWGTENLTAGVILLLTTAPGTEQTVFRKDSRKWGWAEGWTHRGRRTHIIFPQPQTRPLNHSPPRP